MTSLIGTCLLWFKRNNALAWCHFCACPKNLLNCGQHRGMDELFLTHDPLDWC